MELDVFAWLCVECAHIYIQERDQGLRRRGRRGILQSHVTHPDIWTYALGRINLKTMLHLVVYVEEDKEEWVHSSLRLNSMIRSACMRECEDTASRGQSQQLGNLIST